MLFGSYHHGYETKHPILHVFPYKSQGAFQKTLTRFRYGFKRRTPAPRAPSLRLAAAGGFCSVLLKAIALGCDVQPLRLQTTSHPVLYAHSSKHLSVPQLSGMMHLMSAADLQTSLLPKI